MLRMSAVYLCLAVAASALAGCAAAPPYPDSTVYWGTFPQQPPDYSPDYASVPWSTGRDAHAMCSSRGLALQRTRQSLRSWDRICRQAAPTPTTFSAWPSASPTWFAAARSARLPRLRRRERRRNTFMAPRMAPRGAPWAAAFRACRAPRRRAPGLKARRRSLPGRGEQLTPA